MSQDIKSKITAYAVLIGDLALTDDIEYDYVSLLKESHELLREIHKEIDELLEYKKLHQR